MITIKIKADSISLKELKTIAEGVHKIGVSLLEKTNLLLEVGTLLVDDNGQNIAKKAVQAIVLDCLNTPNDEFSKVLQSEGDEIKCK